MTKKMKIMFVVFLLFYILLSCLSIQILPVYASTIKIDGGYTSVLEDLKIDTDFNVNNYPIRQYDYSLSVIQLAESSDKEIFVYVYQPNEQHGKYLASTINISASLHNRNNIKNYKLTLLNYDGVFQKYLVNGLRAQNSDTRYYDVVSIYRVFDETIDEGLSDDNENTIDEVVFKVAQQYTIKTVENGNVNISMTATEFETIAVTSKYVGFMRYKDGWHFIPNNYEMCDSHFVAFSTDKPIDKLYEIDVAYTTQLYMYAMMGYPNYNIIGPSFTPENPEDYVQYAYLNWEQHGGYKGDGFFAHSYKWNVIQTAEEFIKSENENRDNMFSIGLFNIGTKNRITDEGLSDIKNQQWVVRFAETEYRKSTTSDSSIESYTIVGNVSILRLAFETEGVYYNLPVIDNKQTGDGVPDNEQTFSMELSDMFKIILALLLLIILIVLLSPFLPVIISFIFKVIKIIFKVVVWIISLPFKLFGFVFGRNKKKMRN